MGASFKKSISILLSLVMLCATFSLAFSARGADVLAGGKCGDNISWTITDDGTLTVSGVGAITPLERQVWVETTEVDEYGVETPVSYWDTETYFPWDDAYTEIIYKALGYADKQAYDAAWDTGDIDYAAVRHLEVSSVKSIVLEEGITQVESNAFTNFRPLEITLPASLKSMESSAFCAGFAKSIIIKNPTLVLDYAIEIYAYEEENPPFATPEEMIEAEINDEMLRIYSFFLGEKTIYEETDYDVEREQFVVLSSTPMNAYPWLTVYGGKDSTAQQAAETTAVNFVEIDVEIVPEKPATVWEKISAFFVKVYQQLKLLVEKVVAFLTGVFKK